MAIHRLADAPCVITVASVEEVMGKFGMQVRFSGEDGTDLYVSETAASRGLARLNLKYDTCVGKTLHFEQVKKDGKTFTNINLDGGERPANTPKASAPASAPSKRSVEELGEVYERCMDIVFKTLVQRCEETGIPIDASAVQAATATLFIAAK